MCAKCTMPVRSSIYTYMHTVKSFGKFSWNTLKTQKSRRKQTDSAMCVEEFERFSQIRIEVLSYRRDLMQDCRKSAWFFEKQIEMSGNRMKFCWVLWKFALNCSARYNFIYKCSKPPLDDAVKLSWWRPFLILYKKFDIIYIEGRKFLLSKNPPNVFHT